jgi:hypothetical protein
MKTIIVNGLIFRSETAARSYCEKNGYRVTKTATQKAKNGARFNVSVWDVTSGNPEADYITAQENAYFDNFCLQNNI